MATKPKSTRGGRGGNGGQLATAVKDQAGNDIDLTGFPLRFGKNDKNVSGGARKLIDAFEEKRIKGKLEYSFATDPDGNALAETRGGKRSVTTPRSVKNNAKIFTHIHPRDTSVVPGYLGGTFSKADLVNWSTYHPNIETYRAAAAEGTYSITKGSDFDAYSFADFARGECNKPYENYTAYVKDLNKRYRAGQVTGDDYIVEARNAFNRAMVETHNILIDNQKKYGYTYTLERRQSK